MSDQGDKRKHHGLTDLQFDALREFFESLYPFDEPSFNKSKLAKSERFPEQYADMSIQAYWISMQDGASWALNRYLSDIEALAYIPGSYTCPRCGFVWVKSSVNADTGEIGTTEADRLPDFCPNDGELMVRTTYRKQFDGVFAEFVKLQEMRHRLKDLLDRTREEGEAEDIRFFAGILPADAVQAILDGRPDLEIAARPPLFEVGRAVIYGPNNNAIFKYDGVSVSHSRYPEVVYGDGIKNFRPCVYAGQKRRFLKPIVLPNGWGLYRFYTAYPSGPSAIELLEAISDANDVMSKDAQ